MELRFVEREDKELVSDAGYGTYKIVKTRILQYREYTPHGGLSGWSAWHDVPLVTDDD